VRQEAARKVVTSLIEHAGRARRRLVGALLACLILVGGSLAFRPARSQEPVDRPNILIIISDDQRAMDTMHVMPRTRRLLGERGTKFDQFYATTPVCCPSRSTLLSGRYAHNHFVQNNLLAQNLDQNSTIEHYLQRSGYKTAIAGKFLNGWPVAYQRPPFFDRWATTHGGYYGKRFNVNGNVRKVHKYSVDFVREQAIKNLQHFEGADDQPWFMYLAPAPPHSPYIAEPRYNGSLVGEWAPSPAVTESDRTDKPLYVQESNVPIKRSREVREKQLRTLRSLDDMVGSVVRAMEDLEEEEDTLMIFLSDNGHIWGEHGLNAKRVPYTEAIQVPFFMRWDGHIAAGATDSRLGAMVDVMPTLLEAAGVPPSPEWPLDGRSLLAPPGRDRLLIEHWTQPGKNVPTFASTRTGSYQYIEYYDADGLVVAREYYDLVNDPWQLDNLLGDSDPGNDPDPDTILRLSDQLGDDRQCDGSDCP
jgi:arylsulfatase A-like enzyme